MSNDFHIDFKKLRLLMLEKGYSLQHLALAAGVPLRKLKAMEKHGHATTYARALRISSRLRVNIEEIRE